MTSAFIVITTAILSFFVIYQIKTLDAGASGTKFYGNIAGESKLNNDGSSRQKILKKLKEGDSLDIIDEPDNPYDKKAVAVYSQYGQIGYLPRDSNERRSVLQALKQGKNVTAEIAGIGAPKGVKFLGALIIIQID